MAEVTLTYPLNFINYDAEDAEAWLATRSSGLYANNSFQFSVTGADTSVTFGKGLAWIHNHEFAGKAVKNSADLTIDFGLSDALLPRYDIGLIRFSKADNRTEIVVKNGTLASTPVYPEIVQTEDVYELYLCAVYRAAGSVTITNADVTDLRLSEYCGLMADSVTSVDTTAINNQIMAMIERLQSEIDGVNDTTEFMLKTVYDSDGDGVVDNANKINGTKVWYDYIDGDGNPTDELWEHIIYETED